MSESGHPCVNEACSCLTLEGRYCSDYCAATAGQGIEVCDCGHRDCVGSGPADITS